MSSKINIKIGWVAGWAMLAMCSAARADFTKGDWTLQLYGSYTQDTNGRHLRLPSTSVGIGYFITEHYELNLELSGIYVDQPGDDAGALSARLLLRHFLLHFDRLNIFADVGGGIFEASTDVPPGGTRFDLTIQTGIGATFELRKNLYLLGGARYFHLSNARIEGSARNPSINGVEGYLGLMWKL